VNDYLDGKTPTDNMDYPEVGKLAFKNNQVVMPTVVITKENAGQFNF
jgi:hypothetical protein